MRFLNRISDLRNAYASDSCGTQDNASLYGICNPTPPLAEHIIFLPMPEKVMQDLIRNYKRTFPRELLTLYGVMNGADLFWTTRLVGGKIRIPLCRFSIYGIPLTADRIHIEPFNVSIEDLHRPKGTPESWLKFGSYYRPDDLSNRLDLFVDTDNSTVYAVAHDDAECNIAVTWPSIDDSLCSIFDSL